MRWKKYKKRMVLDFGLYLVHCRPDNYNVYNYDYYEDADGGLWSDQEGELVDLEDYVIKVAFITNEWEVG